MQRALERSRQRWERTKRPSWARHAIQHQVMPRDRGCSKQVAKLEFRRNGSFCGMPRSAAKRGARRLGIIAEKAEQGDLSGDR